MCSLNLGYQQENLWPFKTRFGVLGVVVQRDNRDASFEDGADDKFQHPHRCKTASPVDSLNQNNVARSNLTLLHSHQQITKTTTGNNVFTVEATLCQVFVSELAYLVVRV